jgi:hypothetical protein
MTIKKTRKTHTAEFKAEALLDRQHQQLYSIF